MHYLLFYEKTPDSATREQPFQAAHRAYVQAAVGKGLILAGSLADPVDGAALLLFEADSPANAETFAAGDPYVIHGIVDRWRVRAWDTVFGTLANPLRD